MQEVFEKIIEKLEEYEYENLVEHDSEMANHCKQDCNDVSDCTLCVWDKAIEIVKQEAEQYNNGWILCREHQPEEAGTYNVTAYDGRKLRSTHAKWQPRLKSWNLTGTMAYWKVIAWQPLPQPYQLKKDRANCKNRHENGNCLAIGGFCTSVDDKYCKYQPKGE